jgi:hypothetical protein
MYCVIEVVESKFRSVLFFTLPEELGIEASPKNVGAG